jgi:aryl sulfotransferase
MTAPAGIVWLASFPKSGNTWLRILLANLAAGENGPADINDLDERGGIASSRREFELATMLDSGLMPHDDVDLLRPAVHARAAAAAQEQRWVKVHDAYTLNAAGEPLLGRCSALGAIYLVRDPRDVAVSLAHHNNTSIDAAIDLLNAEDGALCRGRTGLAPQLRQKLLGWSGHAASWLDQTDTPVHVVRYEQMRDSPASEFAAALAFAHRPASAEEIARAVRHSDFDELQRQEMEKGFAERLSRSTAPFFRTGQAGGWRDALTATQISRIETAHRRIMRRLGYRPVSANAKQRAGESSSMT